MVIPTTNLPSVGLLFSSPPPPKICHALFSFLNDVALARLSICSTQWAVATGVERKYRIIRQEDMERTGAEKMSNLLLEAARFGSLRIVTFACENGAQVNAKDEEGKTALWLAVLAESESAVQYLCEHGADLAVTDAKKWTVFQQAIQSDSEKIIRVLHKCSSKLEGEVKTAEGHTLMMMAAAKGSLRIVRMLHRSGADLNARDNYGHNATHLASIFDHADVLDYLAQNRSEINAQNKDGTTPLLYCVRSKNLENVKVLTERGADLRLIGNETSPFFEAIEQNNVPMVAYFCEMGAHEVKNDERKLLEFAIGFECPKGCKLISHRKEVTKQNLNTLAIAIRIAKAKLQEARLEAKRDEAKGYSKIVEILAKASQIRKNALRVKQWNTALKKEDVSFVSDTLEEFLTEDWHEYLLRIVSLSSNPISFFISLMSIFRKHPKYESLIINVFKKLCNDPTFDSAKILSSSGRDRESAESILHAASYHGFVAILKTLVDWGMNPRSVLFKGENALQYLLRNPSNLSEDQLTALMDAAAVTVADAECIFGVPYSTDWVDDAKRRTFRMYFLKKAEAHLNKLMSHSASAFRLWITRKFRVGKNGLELLIDTIPHLFLIGQFFKDTNILCHKIIGQDQLTLTLPCLTSYDNIMALKEGQFSEKRCASLTDFAAFLRELPGILNRLFPIQWELYEEDLRASLDGDHLSDKRKQLQLVLDHFSREKKCQLPFEIQFERNNGEEASFIAVPAVKLRPFLNAGIAFTIVDFENWKTVINMILNDQIIQEEQLNEKLEILEKQRIRQRKEELEKAEQRRIPAQKRGKPSAPGPKEILPKKRAEKTNSSKGKGAAKKPPASAPLPQNRPKDLPLVKISMGTRSAPLAPPASFAYPIQAATLSSPSNGHFDFRPGPVNGGIELILPHQQRKAETVQECFERLHGIFQLDENNGSPSMKLGAMLFNGMLIDLACDSLPLASPVRDLCSYGADKSSRDFWAHHCFPRPYQAVPVRAFCDHHSVLKAINPMTKGNFAEKQIFDEAKKQITLLFSEFRSFRLSWETVFADKVPDPRHVLTAQMTEYLTALKDLKHELMTYSAGDKRHSYTLDAIAFYVSRMGELAKHLASCSKEYRQLRNEIIHCFDNDEDAIRETLHAKCLSLLDKLVQFKLSKMNLLSPWEPYVNEKYRYPIKLTARILSWRLQELEASGFKAYVHDPVILSELDHQKVLLEKRAAEGLTLAVIPLKLADQKSALLAIQFEKKQIKTVTYHVVDADRETIPQEVIQFSAPCEVKKVVQAEKKETTREDHGPLLVERTFQLAKSIATKQNDKMGTIFQMRKRHLLLAFAHGFPELYLKQFFLKGIKKNAVNLVS